MKKTYLFLTFSLLFSWAMSAQNSPIGVWKTIDDKTGEPKSHVEIFQKDGKYHGKVVKLLKSSPDKICDQCPGTKKNKPILGMVILENLAPYKYYWKGGNILDPETGNEYGCSIWFENDNTDELQVRGKHWTGLFRTQVWYRVQ